VQKNNPIGPDELQQTWDPVVDIRNKIHHGRMKWHQRWEETLAPFIVQLIRIRQLISVVEEVTNRPYSGT
jgi:hypothetical protein